MDEEHGLQVLRNERHQRHEWQLETIAWAFIAVILVAAVGGLLGPGPLSTATARAGGLTLDYQRFVHYQGPQRLTFRLAGGPDGGARLWIDRAFVETMEIEQVDPWPDAVEAEAGRYVWVLRAPRAGERFVATIRYRPDRMGLTRGHAGIDGGPQVSFWQFAYP